MFAHLLMLALSAAPSSWGAAIQTYGQGPWTLVRRYDGFRSGVVCTLSGRRMRVDGAVVMFDLGAAARRPVVVRLDHGPPMELDTDADLDPIRASSRRTLWNPNGGWVALPTAMVATARTVWIEGAASASPVRFTVEGLARMLGAEATLACPT